jgi:hypothetical protein
MPAVAGFPAIVDFYRREIQRRYALLRTVWLWYLLPLFAGPTVIIAGAVVTRPESWPSAIGAFAGFLVMGVFVVLLNRGAAQKLRQRIDSLATMEDRP